MTNKIAKIDGELREDGQLVVETTETPDGVVEKTKVGKLKIRGEKESRTIPYEDYARLYTFFENQSRLVAERKNFLIRLTDGLVVNTADITSLELTDGCRFVARELTQQESRIRALPTSWVLLDLDLNPIVENGRILGGGSAYFPEGHEYWYIAKCHYRFHRENRDGRIHEINDGFITKPMENVPELLRVRRGPDNPECECLSERICYGVEMPLESSADDD